MAPHMADHGALMPRRRVFGVVSGVMVAWTAAGTPARATPADVVNAMAGRFGERKVVPGRVKLDLPNLVENGNTVTMTLSVDEAPSDGGGRIVAFHVFAEANPLPNVVKIELGPRSGRPKVSTRIRLATSQTVIAVAECADGSLWSDSVELLVTLAACLE